MQKQIPQYRLQEPKGTIIIVTGPSGVGKDSILEEIAKRPEVVRIVTTTTRPTRESEVEGNPYYFVKDNEFQKLINDEKLFEYDFHYGHWYGITHNELKEKIQHPGIILWKVDMKGMKTISKLLAYVITVGIIPDSQTAPEERYKKRGEDTKEDLQKRLEEDKEMITYLKKNANHLVINKEGKLKEAIQDFHNILNQYT